MEDRIELIWSMLQGYLCEHPILDPQAAEKKRAYCDSVNIRNAPVSLYPTFIFHLFALRFSVRGSAEKKPAGRNRMQAPTFNNQASSPRTLFLIVVNAFSG